MDFFSFVFNYRPATNEIKVLLDCLPVLPLYIIMKPISDHLHVLCLAGVLIYIMKPPVNNIIGFHVFLA